MKTKQGKEVNYSDILLYSVNMKNIIAIVNDEEQMKKFSQTGHATDAPIVVLPYSDEELTNIINSMKQIENIVKTEDGNIEVTYEDATNVKFDASNEKIIESNHAEQRKTKERENIVGSWADIPETEKAERKRQTKKKVTKSLSAILAATILAGGLYSCSKFGKKESNDSNKETTSQTTPVGDNVTEAPYEEYINPTEPRKTEESTVQKSDFTKEAEALYQSTVDVNPFIIKFQQVAQVKWDRELALELVEYINGVYPTAMTYMTDENAKAEATELMQAINLIIAGNLNPESKESEMIDLSQYVANEKERVLVYNAMVIARACIQESIGEPMNGKIIEDDSEINKFSREYTNSVDRLLHYEFDTINSTEFLMSSGGARFLIASIFQNINNTIPQWSYVTRHSSEQDQRQYDLYYRYFFDDYEKITYLPEPGKNGTNVYYAYWKDEESKCHKEGPYTEDVMHAMAGKPLEEDKTAEMLGIEVNPNIHQLGIQTEVDNRVDDSRTEFFQQTVTYTNCK